MNPEKPSPAALSMPAKLAVAQLPVHTGSLDKNVSAAVEAIRDAGSRGQNLLVFPECFLSGYLFDSRAETEAHAITLGNERFAALTAACRDSDVHAVVGYLESDGGAIYNSAATIGPDGIAGNYRKQHLPYLGADRFADPGDGGSDRVIKTPFGRVGVMICFDLRFPESARELGLKGADVIAMPTNWPAAATFLAEHVTRVRAVENLVYLAVANRPDAERGTKFLGCSQVIAPTGEVLIHAGTESGVYGATADLALARTKHLVIEPGRYELGIFTARRPELYSELTRRQDS